MKLIMENWRRYLNENVQLSKPSEILMRMLLNFKTLKSTPQDFISRAKIVVHTNADGLNFSLLMDDKIAGMVRYYVLDKTENCRPSPFQSKPTYMLGNVARGDDYRGLGIGSFITFLSVCYVNSIGGTVTSDRDTSDKAGKHLVNALKMVKAKKSKQFDYVGHFVRELDKRFFDSKGEYKAGIAAHMAPRSNKTGIAALTKGFHDNKLANEFEESFPELLKKVINHLKPLTPQKDDDCEPSSNIMISDKVGLRKLLYSKELPKFLEKALTMSTQEFQDFLNSDERVQGFTFVLSDDMISSGKEIMKAIDATANLSPKEREKITAAALEMFVDVYDAEIGKYGVAKE